MTFLELVQKAIKWSRVRSSVPSTLVNPNGLVESMADMIAASWKELQLERPDWMWNRVQSATGVIKANNNRFFIRQAAGANSDNRISGQITYDADTGAGSISSADISTLQPRIQQCTVGINDDLAALKPDNLLTYIEFDDWIYEDEESDEVQKPVWYTISPEGQLLVYPIPDVDYRLYFELPKVPQTLENDADAIIGIPEYMQDGIVWRGILYYALAIQDPGMVEMARVRYNPYKKWLEQTDMPRVTLKTGALY